MTIDFSQTTGTLYFQGTRPSYTDWHITLEGRYSNNLLKFSASSTELALTVDEYKTNWFSFDWSNSYNQNLDIAGYYYLKLYGDDTLAFTRLVKVINSTGIEPEVAYASTDNENNEQFIYYR